MDIQALRKEHIHNQSSAADPQKSVWVSANAGAGKTRVLVDRIIRMLLPPFDAAPSKILCMTFTKAAAAEMADRLFQRLGEWIAFDDETLSKEILALTGKSPNHHDLISARRLFARALETPGGLKIQTIHAFCEHILGRFPVEAGISSDFTVLQDADIDKLFREALDDIAKSLISNPNSPAAASLERLSLIMTRDGMLQFFKSSRAVYKKCQKQEKNIFNPHALSEFFRNL